MGLQSRVQHRWLSENISNILDQDRDAGKKRIRELWEESKGRNMVGDWNPQKNVASEKSPRAPCLKSFIELQCPIFSSKSFLWLNPSPPLFKISVQSTELGWSKEVKTKRWIRTQVDMEQRKEESHRLWMWMSICVMEARTMDHKWSWERETQQTHRNLREINGASPQKIKFWTWPIFM